MISKDMINEDMFKYYYHSYMEEMKKFADGFSNGNFKFDEIKTLESFLNPLDITKEESEKAVSLIGNDIFDNIKKSLKLKEQEIELFKRKWFSLYKETTKQLAIFYHNNVTSKKDKL